MKVVQALRNPNHERQLVTLLAPFQRENGPPGTERDPRPNAHVPAEEKDIRRILTHRAVQIPWTGAPVAHPPTGRIVRRRQIRTRSSGRPHYSKSASR